MIVPNAMQVLMWRACKNVLPTKVNLIKRKVVNDILCPICGTYVNTMGHILWSYLAARDAWSMYGRRLQKSSVEKEKFIHIVEELEDILDDDDFALLVVVARNL